MKANVTVTGKLGNYEITCSVEIGSGEYIQEQIFEALQNEYPELKEDEQVDTYSISFEVTGWGDLDGYENIQKESLEDIADLKEDDLDLIEAGLYCGVSLSNIEEAYQGKFGSDEDFAQDMAEQLGEIPKDAHWPLYCIDWEHAARELMMDYNEHDGYYFRIM